MAETLDPGEHTDKEVREALVYAMARGWRLIKGGHWGILMCHQADREGCRFSVAGTPRNAGNEAKRIRRRVDGCPHVEDTDG